MSALVRNERIRDAMLASTLVLLIVGVTSQYLSRMRTISFWDAAMYQDLAYRWLDVLRASFLAFPYHLAGSVWRDDYNGLFTVPLIPFMLVFGESKSVYEMTLICVYLLGFLLAIGLLGTRLIPATAHLGFWIAIALALLLPSTWIPLLQGFPDPGGEALVLLAIYFFLLSPSLEHRWHTVLIGACIVGAMIFRRPFVYSGVALFLAIGLFLIVKEKREAVGSASDEGTAPRIVGMRFAKLIALTGLLLLPTGSHLLQSAYRTDLGSAYASYTYPPVAVLQGYVAMYGWVTVVLGCLGYVVGVWTGAVRRDAAAFLLTFGVLTFGVWAIGARQISPHYMAQFTGVIALGIASLAWTIWVRLRGGWRLLAAGAVALGLSTNMFIGATTVASGNNAAWRPLFGMNAPPQQLRTYDGVRSLAVYLHRSVSPRAGIYVVASSLLMNGSMVTNAEEDLYGRGRANLNVLTVPDVDRPGQNLPVGELQAARYFVLVRPFQHHLAVRRQTILKVVYDLFACGTGVARKYHQLPTQFVLGKGVVASIYVRTDTIGRPTIARTLSFMQKDQAAAATSRPCQAKSAS